MDTQSALIFEIKSKQQDIESKCVCAMLGIMPTKAFSSHVSLQRLQNKETTSLTPAARRIVRSQVAQLRWAEPSAKQRAYRCV